MIFQDRAEAGVLLGEKLVEYKNAKDTVVIALPRGGVVVACEICRILHLPLDIVCPRKITAPGNPEFAIGAVDEMGNSLIHREIIDRYNISDEYIDTETKKQVQEAKRRLALYRGERKPIELKSKTVLLIDDGIATGATMKAAIGSLENKKVKKIIVAAPVSADDTYKDIEQVVDEIVCLEVPEFFGAVGSFYAHFGQTTDTEVIELMQKTNNK